MIRRPLQRGFSIAEFMVAIAIGMFLTTGLVGMYISGKTSYNTTEAVSRTQENARFAMDVLTRFLRLADYRPDNETETTTLFPSIADSVRGCTEGVNCGAGFPGNSDLPAVHAPGTDAIHVKYKAAYTGLRDCEGNVLTKNDDVAATFAVGRSAAGNPLSLFCNNAPLVQGVTDLQITYGIRVTGTTIKYVATPDVADWPKVISLRVTVSVDPGDATLPPEAVDGVERDYMATIHLRNRLL